VPYKGRQFAIPDLVGGQIQVMFDNMPSALPMAKEGKIRALAQTTAKRSARRARRAHGGRDRARLRGHHLVRGVCAGRARPATVVLKAERRDCKRVFALPEVTGQAQDPGPRAVDLHPRGADPLPGRRDHQVGEGGEGLGREGGLTEITKWAKVVKESGARAD
jgi:hypothetical protein